MLRKRKRSTRRKLPRLNLKRVRLSSMELVGIVSLALALLCIFFPGFVDRIFEQRFRGGHATKETESQTIRQADLQSSAADLGRDSPQFWIPRNATGIPVQDNDPVTSSDAGMYGRWRQR